VYRRPQELGQALDWLAAARPAVLAGGTDFYPARLGEAPDAHVLDLSALGALRGVERAGDHWRIGALTTWTELLRAGLPPGFEALRQAAIEVGGPQIQNRGTLGGNLCNASPAADGVPVLLALDASVELASLAGTRLLPVGEFLLGSRRTARRPDELLVAIRVPDRVDRVRSRFLKLGHRRYLVISVAMVAAVVGFDDRGNARSVALAVGACSAAARRLPALEAALVGLPADRLAAHAADLLAERRHEHLAPLSPIDDVRGTARYRLDAVATLVVRALQGLAP